MEKVRKEFQLTDEQVRRILDACRSTPLMYLSGGKPMFPSPQERANDAWVQLGNELGFDGMTVRPVPGKSQHFITAEVQA